MKVYIVLHHNWQDYEGGGAEVVAVFGDREKAFAKVKKLLPASARRRAKEDAEEWHFPEPSMSASHYWLTIDEHEVE